VEKAAAEKPEAEEAPVSVSAANLEFSPDDEEQPRPEDY